MKPSDGPNTQEIHEIPALHSLVPCNSLVSKLILKKTAKDQGCLGIKGTTSPLHVHRVIGSILRNKRRRASRKQTCILRVLSTNPQGLVFCEHRSLIHGGTKRTKETPLRNRPGGEFGILVACSKRPLADKRFSYNGTRSGVLVRSCASEKKNSSRGIDKTFREISMNGSKYG